MLYVSDLHLSAVTDDQEHRFTRFLREVPKEGDVLVLGGDIFDLFVGNKPSFLRQHGEIISALKAFARMSGKIFYLEGNHDFHLKKVFSDTPGISVESGPFCLEFFGRKYWVAHGDEIDREDRGYLFLRRLTRSLFFRVFLYLLPDVLVDGIGRWSSRTSRRYNDAGRLPEEKKERTKHLFREHAHVKIREGFSGVFLGHSHLADESMGGDQKGFYVNLGFSESEIPYVEIDGKDGILRKMRFV